MQVAITLTNSSKKYINSWSDKNKSTQIASGEQIMFE